MRKLFFIMMAVLACTLGAFAQTKTYKGTVVDASNNEPLIGATVSPIGGGQGTATDIDGKFSITVPTSVKVVRVSYVGYTTKEVELKEGMTVHLSSTSTELNDVVVVAYGTATKESLTGSVAMVNSEEIERRPVNSITSALEGSAPGVQISSSTVAGPGGSPSILIRGINTVNGTNAPVYVLDGVIYNGSISEINPEDVESMSVLKDAASCALYGAKGANGVVLITTKKAKNKSKVNVTLKVNQGVYERGLPFYDRLGTNQWMETTLLSMTNGQYSLNSNELSYNDVRKAQIENFFGNAKVWNVYGDNASDKIFNEQGQVVLNPLSQYNDLDWWDSFSQTGYRQEYNVSIAGGTDKFNAYVSTGYLKSQGYIINTDFERFTNRINMNATPVDYLRLGVNANIGYQKSQDDDVDSDNLGTTNNPFNYTYRAPVFPYYNHDVKTGEIIYNEKGEKEWNTTAGYTPYESNIAYLTRSNDNRYDKLTASLSMNAAVILPYGFELSLRGDMYRAKQTYNSFGNPWIGSAKGFGRLRVTNYNTKTYTFMQALNWSHDYGNHHIDVLLDHENYSYDYGYNYEQVMNMVFTNGPRELTNFTDNESYSAYHIQRTTESYLGRVRWNLDQKYFAEASIRRDGTSRFAKDSRWGTFWSVGASWILSKEKFMQNLDWLNNLKLRAAYGTVGQDAAASSYAYWSLYAQRAARVDSQLVMSPSQLGNDKAKWESTNTLDVALEGNVLNNRLSFSIGYFLKQNADLLYNVTQPMSAGGTWSGSRWTILTNIGTMQNVGWELMVKGDVIRTKDFTWGLNADASIIKNKLTKLPPSGNQWTSNIALIKGKSRYEFYMINWAGVDMTTGRSLYEINPDSHTFESLNAETGEWEYDQALWNANLEGAEKNNALVKIGDRYYTTQETYASKHFQGSSLPTMFGSFGTSLRWKDISLNAVFTYSLGGKVFDSQYRSLMSYGEGKTSDFHKDILNSWTEAPAGINPDDPASRISKDINPQINTQYSTYDNASSNRWLTNASYLQFKNISVAYDFPKVVTGPLKLQGLNVGFTAENLFTVTKRKGINPAYNYSGGQGNYFVVSRTFSFSLTARF
ncbi:MAG: SusC/RagA family TonB-linked outer membrane protein [Muribaculaceae bacterium]|nr:SusC/RagA family TonB-linked outer membrane protein [Muribaculaceae bacterium]